MNPPFRPLLRDFKIPEKQSSQTNLSPVPLNYPFILPRLKTFKKSPQPLNRNTLHSRKIILTSLPQAQTQNSNPFSPRKPKQTARILFFAQNKTFEIPKLTTKQTQRSK
ncbi:hypothetical protein [Burkholderia singularis]|uniref:hypothetical protein n=1 Tax=Burkholderia singularis TaxID=1503053 RepID=UPI00117EEEF9|nr:hypothetical protein [Burkholderia singularis]